MGEAGPGGERVHEFRGFMDRDDSARGEMIEVKSRSEACRGICGH